jgi:hypothetical protein
VRLQLSVLAYNPGNLWRQLVLPKRIDHWSLTSVQQRLVKTGACLVKHARYYRLLLAESHLTQRCRCPRDRLGYGSSDIGRHGGEETERCLWSRRHRGQL